LLSETAGYSVPYSQTKVSERKKSCLQASLHASELCVDCPESFPSQTVSQGRRDLRAGAGPVPRGWQAKAGGEAGQLPLPRPLCSLAPGLVRAQKPRAREMQQPHVPARGVLCRTGAGVFFSPQDRCSFSYKYSGPPSCGKSHVKRVSKLAETKGAQLNSLFGDSSGFW